MADSDLSGLYPGQPEGLHAKFKYMIERVSPEDLFSAAEHSRDFRSSRAEYVSVRIRILAFIFAALAPLWIPIDYLVMDAETFQAIVPMRLAFSVALVALGSWGGACNHLAAARVRVLLFVLVAGVFYVGSRLLFGNGLPETGVLAGYSFLPFLMIALLAVVPLTFLEGASYALVTAAFFVGAELYFGTLFTIATLGDLWLLALLGLIAVWVQMTQLHMLLRLYREATRDALTGLVNRRVLFRWLEQEVAQAPATGAPLSVLLFDLDLFKRINDNYGHLAGDAVLQSFGLLLRQQLSGNELVGRYGGEEFLVILPDTPLADAHAAAERIRLACRELRVRNPDGSEPIGFTTSTGVAELRRGESGEMLLARVDQGLYQAKESGRDLVAVAD